MHWKDDSSFKGNHRVRPLWIEWTQVVLREYKLVLEHAGVYGAIYCSLFHYQFPNQLMKAFLENWNKATHTALLREGEISISLWDMRHIAGLPIVGFKYDEHIPVDKHPDLLPLYDHYLELAEDNKSNLQPVSGNKSLLISLCIL
jgi:hypothetical protein